MDKHCCSAAVYQALARSCMTAAISIFLLASCDGSSTSVLATAEPSTIENPTNSTDTAANQGSGPTPDIQTPTTSETPISTDTLTGTDNPITPQPPTSTESSTTEPLTGVFLDSAVTRLGYSTASQAGFTDEQGRFSYRSGETITFSIGDIQLPEVTAQQVVTPADLYPGGAVNHRGVVNVSRLLQTLDIDNDPSNGILLADWVNDIKSAEPLDFESVNFSESANNLLSAYGGSSRSLVAGAEAISHLAITMTSFGLPVKLIDEEQVLVLLDTNTNGIPNEFDWDDDGDGVNDPQDAFPLNPSEQFDTDHDGIGNNTDPDDDNDGYADTIDAFPFSVNENKDSDNDGIGDQADTDDDNDGTLDHVDAYPLDAREQLDADADGIGNNADNDDDNDGVPDNRDAFPFSALESLDTDADGIGDNADSDDDNDGVNDIADAFPHDATEFADTDADGIGNNADEDDNGDGIPDGIDTDNGIGENTPPNLSVPANVLVSNRVNGQAIVGVSDAENNTVRLSWSVVSGPLGGDMMLTTNDAFTRATIQATVIGQYVIGVTATDGIDSTYRTFTVQVANSAPVLSQISILPLAPTAVNYLQPTYAPIVDADDDTLQISYTWIINNVASDYIGDSLPPGTATRGDTVAVTIQVTDGTHTVSASSTAVELENSPPMLQSIEILPLAATVNDELIASLTGLSDADTDTIELSFVWSVNDQVLPGQVNNSLPAGIAKHRDTVSVQVIMTDGVVSIENDPVTIEINNAPAAFQADSVPSSLTYGVPTSFTAMFVDPDGTDVNTLLTSAPQGLTYDAATGTVNWTPTPLMLQSTESYQAHFTSSDGQLAEIELNVVDSNHNPLLARSGIEVPRRSQPLDSGDFDGDGVIEVLSSTRNQRIFTLQLDGDEIKQDWMYPFALGVDEDIHSVWAHGADRSQIIAVTDNGVFLIESRDAEPVRVAESLIEISAARYTDLDANGVAELILIDVQGNLSVLSSNTWDTIWPDISLQSSSQFGVNSYAFEVANVDTDSALEIITSTGDVIDGVTGVVEWKHTSDFGLLITVGDIDGDNDQDIIASSRWDKVTSYDVASQTSIWQYDLTDTCALQMINVDADPQDKLIHGGCQHGRIEIYDGATGTAVMQEFIDDPEFNSGFTSLTVADIDNDGIEELVFGTGTSSSAEDNMVFASIPSTGDTTPGIVINTNPAQIGAFYMAGWDTITQNSDNVVVVMPDTNGVSDGQRIGLLPESGDLTVSDVIDSNWSRLHAAAVVDSNSDGIAEIVVATARTYTGRLVQLNLNDFSQLAEHLDSEEARSVAIGTDANGSIKAVLASDDSKLRVYDIASAVNDWTSGGLSGGTMLGAITRSTDNGFEIIAATNSELTVWTPNATGYLKSYTAAATCDHLDTITVENDPYIVCIENSSRSSTLQVFDTQLVKQVERLINYEITAIESTNDHQLLIGASANIGQSFTSQKINNLRLIDPIAGNTVWTSAPLLGEINGLDSITDSETGLRKLAVTTSAAVYIAR